MPSNNTARYCRCVWFLLLSVLPVFSLQAQDLGNIGKEKLLKVNGGISASSIYYASNDVNRRNPFSYYLNGSLNLSIYGWSIPLSFSYSNRTFSYMQPFNQFSLHPTYKWVTAHLGWASMTFSPYTLNGHQFFGAGLELAPPGKWKYSVLYGRFQKGIETAAYRRMGYGFKVGYEDKSFNLAFNLFRSKDDSSSVLFHPTGIAPQENIAMGVNGGVTITKGLRFNMEYAVSVLNRDKRSTLKSSDHAIRAGLNYTHGAFGMGVGYERIDPQYRTLGTYYSNNDYQNITANFTQGIFKQKVVVSANAGVQQDDLDNKKASNMHRLVGGLSVAYQPGEKLQLDASYNNFQSYTNIKPQFAVLNQTTPYDNLDTLNYTQISQQANLNVNYQLRESKRSRQLMNINLSFQDATDKQGDTKVATAGTRFYNAIGGYNLCLIPSSTTMAFALNVSYNGMYESDVLTWGPTFVFSRPFLRKKLKMSGSLSYNTTSTNGEKMMDVYNCRLGGSYVILRKHVFSLSLLSLLRNSNSILKEFTATAGYNYSF